MTDQTKPTRDKETFDLPRAYSIVSHSECLWVSRAGPLMRLITVLLALTVGSAAHAATIVVKPAADGRPARVIIDGDLDPNDGDQFRSKTNFLSKAIISFRSDGGNVVAGIQIGESIRLKGFTT